MAIKTFKQLLDHNAIEFSDKVAFQIRQKSGYKQYTFNQVAAIAAKLQSRLVSLGVQKGDRVALISENRPEWPIAFLAITALGAVAVPLDAMLRQEELIPLIDDSEPKAIILSQRLLELFQGTRVAGREIVMEEFGNLRLNPSILSGQAVAVSNISVEPDDLASIVYTSGTTGSPKGVMLSHGNIISNVAAIVPLFEFGPGDNFLSVLPLHHTFETTGGFLCAFYKGARVTYAESLKSYNLLRNMQETGTTVMCGVPLLYRLFLDGIMREVAEKKATALFNLLFWLSDLSRKVFGLNIGKQLFAMIQKKFGGQIRFFVSGGAAINPEIIKKFELMGFDLLQGYGLTESAPILTANTLQQRRRGAAGKTIPGVEIRIAGEPEGEIIATGPNIMQGYYKRPDLSAEVLDNGWLHTGDIGYFDQDGFLFITGRIKDLIVTGSGVNVYPEEIESWLNRLPSVKESCIFGEKINEGPRQGMEQVVAVVVPKEGFDAEAVKTEIQALNGKLTNYKRIARVIVRPADLPRTRIQKIKRFAVKKEMGIA